MGETSSTSSSNTQEDKIDKRRLTNERTPAQKRADRNGSRTGRPPKDSEED